LPSMLLMIALTGAFCFVVGGWCRRCRYCCGGRYDFRCRCRRRRRRRWCSIVIRSTRNDAAVTSG
jgi:hypothetical protein